MENAVLSAAAVDRKAFQALEKLNVEKDLTPIGVQLYKMFRDFYDRDPDAGAIDKTLLSAALEARFSNPKHLNTIRDVLDRLDWDASAPNIVTTVTELRRKNVGYELAAALTGLAPEERCAELMESWLALKDVNTERDSDTYHQIALSDLEQQVSLAQSIPLAPSALGKKVGGNLVRGHHVVIFGRPNKGKSLAVINQAAVCLKAGLRVLYVENEDPASVTILRLLSRLTELPKEEMFKNKDGTMAKAKALGYDGFFLANLAPGTFREIRSIAERVKPDVIIINQIRNLATPSLSRPEQLEWCSIQARNLAKGLNCVVFSVTQAGESANGKLFLSPDDVEYSKTGVQAACDLMVGIGVNNELEQRGQVMLGIAKNKLSTVHDTVLCRTQPLISKIVGV